MKDKCPICKKPSNAAARPFCSKRCSDIDLGRWLKGNYAIPGTDGEATIAANDTSPDADITFRDLD
ncbi:DNA gyrase inhibitor YacG [Hellea balneolensis]|uniref:DNA gyrase inhibitor YacG n=1 Tax=Hellea balneolensis TaxID=287478 RepID=UPI0004048859|nr:DNA gyrase inhibitor YacG [Hellea balneolensis]